MPAKTLPAPEYKALHYQANRRFPKTGTCEECGAEKRTCWSSIEHRYTLRREDWQELCYSCHARIDAGDRCKHGHLFAEHARLDKCGKRKCRECQRVREEQARRAAGIPPGPHRKCGDPSKRTRDRKGQFV